MKSIVRHLGSKGWGVHACKLDRQCRDVGAPNRVHFRSPSWNLGVALSPSAKFVKTVKTQNPAQPYQVIGTNWTSLWKVRRNR